MGVLGKEVRGQSAEVGGQGEPKGWRWGIADAPAGRIGSEGNGTASALGERSYRAELFFGFYRLRIFCGVCVFCVEWFLNSSAAGRRRSTLKTGTAMNSLCARRAQLQNSLSAAEKHSVFLPPEPSSNPTN